MALNPKQETFCQEYMLDLNATQAAIRAGYSSRNANRTSSVMLAKVDVKNRIQELQAERAEKTALDAEYVIARLKRIADLWEASPSAATRALELLGKHLGIFERDNRQSREFIIEFADYTKDAPDAPYLPE